MASIRKIPGRLLVDLQRNGTVHIVFTARNGSGNEAPFIAKSLDAAEVVFTTCGLSPERAATLRAELEGNKVASVETSVDEAVAAQFCYSRA